MSVVVGESVPHALEVELAPPAVTPAATPEAAGDNNKEGETKHQQTTNETSATPATDAGEDASASPPPADSFALRVNPIEVISTAPPVTLDKKSTPPHDVDHDDDDLLHHGDSSSSPLDSHRSPAAATSHPPLTPSKSSGAILLNDGVDTIRETFTRLALFLTFQSIQEPNTSVKISWDWFVIVLAVYSYFVTAWYIAFDTGLGETLYGFDWAVTVIFLFDILVNFRTGYIDYSGNAIFDSRQIAERYLKSSFALDLLGALPFHVISPAISFGPSSQFVDNCLKVNFLLRASKVVNSERIEAFISPQARILKLLFGFVSMAHVFASLFFFVGSNQTTENTWIKVKGYDERTSGEQYIASLYWALVTMVTVGYGDIVPVTTYEQATVIPILMLSALIYATIFGSMAYAIETITSTIRRYQSRMDSVKEFVKVYELPPELQQKLYDYTNAAWNQTKGFETSEMLSHLPTSVKADIMGFINRTLIERVPLFKQCSDRFLEAIILRMSGQVCLAGDYIFKEGDRSREMYFVRSGSVEIIMEIQGVDRTIAELGSYSDYPFFGEISLLLGETRTASARASTKCVLSKLSQQDFFEVLSMFPEEENSLRETATLRLEQDIEREAKLRAKRERKMQQAAAARSARSARAITQPHHQHNHQHNLDPPSESSSRGDDDDDDAHAAPPPHPPTGFLVDSAPPTKAEDRLRHLDQHHIATNTNTTPEVSTLVTAGPTVASAPASDHSVQTRLSRLNSSVVRHSLFVAHGGGKPVGPAGSGPPLMRTSSLNTSGIRPELLALASLSTNANPTPTPPPPATPAVPPSLTVDTAPSSHPGAPAPLILPSPSSSSPPITIIETPPIPVRKISDHDSRRSLGPTPMPYSFDHIAEEDDERSISRLSAVHSRKMSVAEKYAAGTIAKPNSSARMTSPPSPAGPQGMDALAQLRKTRDSQSQSNLNLSVTGMHNRARTSSTGGGAPLSRFGKVGPGHSPMASPKPAPDEDRIPPLTSGSSKEAYLEEKVRSLEGRINEMTRQMATVMAILQQQQQQQRSNSIINSDTTQRGQTAEEQSSNTR